MTPTIRPEMRDSMAAILEVMVTGHIVNWWSRIWSHKVVTDQIKHLFSVASPRRPPKVMMGVRHAK